MKKLLLITVLLSQVAISQVTDTGGNVGIGTTSPQKKLHIKAAADDGIALETNNALLGKTSSGGFTQLLFWNGSNAYYGRDATGTGVNNHYFRTGGTDRLSINSNGNVGIGTTSPSQKLEIFNPNLFNPNMEAQSQDHISFTSITPGIGNYFGGITWKTGARRRASIVAVQEHTDADHIGLAFFTQGTDGSGPIYESMRIARNGNVGIGTTTPDSKLAVNGTIHTKEVLVDLIGWPDFVFEESYNLPTLEEVEQHIQEKGHLQNIPSAEEVEENGILLGEMDAKLLQKIEELTLYAIEQQKEIEKLKEANETLSKENVLAKSVLERLDVIEKMLESK